MGASRVVCLTIVQAARLPLQVMLLGRERGDDFFEARVAAQRVPPWQQLQFAIAAAVWKVAGAGKLFAGEIVVASPGSDFSKAQDYARAADGILFYGKQLN